MEEKAVLEFLTTHPDFLKQHAAQLGIDTTPNRVIDFSDKRLTALQKQCQQLENHLVTLANNADANDQIRRRQHILTLALLTTNHVTVLIESIHQILNTTFHVTHTALKLWHEQATTLPCYVEPSDKLSQQLHNKKEPICTHYISDELLAWLPFETTPQSFALLPFYDEKQAHFGLLLMGSDDPKRFAPTMYNHYLQEIADAMSMALLRCLNASAG